MKTYTGTYVNPMPVYVLYFPIMSPVYFSVLESQIYGNRFSTSILTSTANDTGVI